MRDWVENHPEKKDRTWEEFAVVGQFVTCAHTKHEFNSLLSSSSIYLTTTMSIFSDARDFIISSFTGQSNTTNITNQYGRSGE